MDTLSKEEIFRRCRNRILARYWSGIEDLHALHEEATGTDDLFDENVIEFTLSQQDFRQGESTSEDSLRYFLHLRDFHPVLRSQVLVMTWPVIKTLR